MERIRKHTFLCILAAFALILAAIPLVQTQMLGMELRRLPGADREDAGNAPVQTSRETAVYDYGYYPDDQWVEEKCGFRVRTGEAGIIRLEMYYPFALSGREEGHISLDGGHAANFTLTGEHTVIELQGKPNTEHYVQIDSYFAKVRDENDRRALAFVLAGLEAE